MEEWGVAFLLGSHPWGLSVCSECDAVHPWLLDREDELLALQCGTAPHGWGLGEAGGVLECSLSSSGGEASLQGDALLTSSCKGFLGN